MRSLPADLAPVAPVTRVAIGSDHTGLALKAALVDHLRKAGQGRDRCGTDGPDPVDYPDIAAAVGKTVVRGEADAGIVIDGAGLGSAIAANKIRGVRAAMCTNATLARYAREHNGANVLALGATLAATGRSERDRRRVADHADAGTAVPAPAAEDSPAGGDVLMDAQLRRSRAADRDRRGRGAWPRRGARATRARATRWLEDCCPDAPAGGHRAGAARLGFHAAGGAPGGVAGLIDHTLLKPDATRQEHREALPEAAEHAFRHRLRQSGVGRDCARLACAAAPVGVCSVVGFPLGATTSDVKHFETHRVIFDGAREVDMVINIGALKSGDLRTVERDIEAVHGPCRAAGVLSKVIIEAAYLTDEEKVDGVLAGEGRGRGLREDVHRLRPGRRDGGGRGADAPRRRRGHGREGGRRRARSRRAEGDGRRRRLARGRDSRRQDRAAVARHSAGPVSDKGY